MSGDLFSPTRRFYDLWITELLDLKRGQLDRLRPHRDATVAQERTSVYPCSDQSHRTPVYHGRGPAVSRRAMPPPAASLHSLCSSHLSSDHHIGLRWSCSELASNGHAGSGASDEAGAFRAGELHRPALDDNRLPVRMGVVCDQRCTHTHTHTPTSTHTHRQMLAHARRWARQQSPQANAGARAT
jgi:hypothetical protein